MSANRVTLVGGGGARAERTAATTHRLSVGASCTGYGRDRVSYAIVFGTYATGQQLKCDAYIQGCVALAVSGSIRSSNVSQVPAKLVGVRGTPKVLRSDPGPNFLSKAVLN